MLETSSTLGLTDRRPDMLYSGEMLDSVSACIAYDMTHDPEVDG
jgi:hypothetical protein